MNSKLLKKEPVTYDGELYYIHLTHYYDGKPAIILDKSDELSHNPEIIVLTTNLEDTLFDEVAVLDNYDFFFRFLEDIGIVSYDRVLYSGFNVYSCGKLIISTN